MTQATISNLIKTQEWQEIKNFFKAEIEDKPLSIKTDGLSAERIALEVLSSQLATKKIMSAIRKFERLGSKEPKEIKPFR
jgi:hypothetical protein